MNQHDKFKEYWESLGKPNISYKRKEIADWYGELDSQCQEFDGNFDYRLIGDKHWELRRRWIDSDFTLPIERLITPLNGWQLVDLPDWLQDCKYRECETVKLPRKLTAENGAKALLMGEFFESREFTCPECDGNDCSFSDFVCHICNGKGTVIEKTAVSWTTIKEIYNKIVEHYGN